MRVLVQVIIRVAQSRICLHRVYTRMLPRSASSK